MDTSMRWFRRLFLLIAAFLSWSPLTGQANDDLGTAICERGARERSADFAPCRVAWDFSHSPREYYWIQRLQFDAYGSEWETQGDPMAEQQTGSTEDVVDGGFLYRVIGCNDRLQTSGCIDSTVFWAPVIPEDVGSLPELITTPEGEHTARSKTLPVAFQVVEYNAALMTLLVTSVDMSSMPPMSELPFDYPNGIPQGTALWDATLDYNVKMAYLTRW